MSTAPGFLIRDGLESDIDACLQLDHAYETDFVWQMSKFDEVGQSQFTFRTERLPRPMTVTYRADPRRLELALPADHCFLVALDRETGELFGYVTMRNQPTHRIALVQDMVVARPFRRHRIGTRLLRVARGWAKEHDLVQMTLETQTKNYPGIQFCLASGFTFSGFNDHYFQNQDIAVFFSQSLR